MEDEDGFTIVTAKSKHSFSLNSPRSAGLASSKPTPHHLKNAISLYLTKLYSLLMNSDKRSKILLSLHLSVTQL